LHALLTGKERGQGKVAALEVLLEGRGAASTCLT